MGRLFAVLPNSPADRTLNCPRRFASADSTRDSTDGMPRGGYLHRRIRILFFDAFAKGKAHKSLYADRGSGGFRRRRNCLTNRLIHMFGVDGRLIEKTHLFVERL